MVYVGSNGIPGLPNEGGARTERCCRQCRKWYLKNEGDCPNCGTSPPGFNKWLRHAQLDRQLYTQASSADKERKYARAVGLE